MILTKESEIRLYEFSPTKVILSPCTWEIKDEMYVARNCVVAPYIATDLTVVNIRIANVSEDWDKVIKFADAATGKAQQTT